MRSFPDVMMPSFALSKWYGLYFVAYLCVMLYIMMNLMLAVVNETFTTAERDKFKKLFLHKRKACQHAFRLLTSRSDSQSMEFRQFEGLMRYYAPYKSPRDVILMYRYMNVSGNGLLTSAEFHSVYDAESLKFEPEYPNIPWYHNAWPPLQFVCQKAHSAIQWPYFEYLVCKHSSTFASHVTLYRLSLIRYYSCHRRVDSWQRDPHARQTDGPNRQSADVDPCLCRLLGYPFLRW